MTESNDPFSDKPGALRFSDEADAPPRRPRAPAVQAPARPAAEELPETEDGGFRFEPVLIAERRSAGAHHRAAQNWSGVSPRAWMGVSAACLVGFAVLAAVLLFRAESPAPESTALAPPQAAPVPPVLPAPAATAMDETPPASGIVTDAAPAPAIVAETVEPIPATLPIESPPAPVPEPPAVEVAQASAAPVETQPADEPPLAETADAPAAPPVSPPAAAAPPASARWWPPPQAGRLNVLYAGRVAQGKAIAVLFDGTFLRAEDAATHLRVYGADGMPVGGAWTLAPNRRMLLFDVTPGRYRVEIDAQLTDAAGRNLAQAVAGEIPVW